MLDQFRILPLPLSVPKDGVWVYGGGEEGPLVLVWGGRESSSDLIDDAHGLLWALIG